MLTIFSTCRSFQHPRFNLIQRNAIGSWLQLKPRPEIIIYGNDPGTEAICQEFKLIHEPNIELSKQGTPMMHAMFYKSFEIASNPIVALISSDIIVFQDTITAINRLVKAFPDFMASVNRYESEKMDYQIDFNDPNWENKVKDGIYLDKHGCGDYFICTKTCYKNGILPFTYGRGSCDNWLVAEAMRLGVSVDITPCVIVVHPQHDHSHIPEKEHDMNTNEDFIENRKLAGEDIRLNTKHSNWVMRTN